MMSSRTTIYIELANFNFRNKGDELMLYAAMEEIRKRVKNVEFCIGLQQEINVDFIKKNELKRVLKYKLSTEIQQKKDRKKKWKYQVLSFFGRYLPNHFVNSFGFVHPLQVNYVFDISGYALSDFWGDAKAIAMEKFYQECIRNGQKIIMLPKSFGPFTNNRIIQATKNIIQSSTLVYCRDRLSYKYLQDSFIHEQNMIISSDYTGSVKGIIPKDVDKQYGNVAIIPNYRMMDKTNRQTSDQYVSFLCFIISTLKKEGWQPFYLLHQLVTDEKVINAIKKISNIDIKTMHVTDSRHIKGILGNCDFIISSRLHGIINGLSQGVPVIGTSWAHKYNFIYEDYQSPELLIHNLDNMEEIQTVLQLVTNNNYREEVRSRLFEAQKRISSKNDMMWNRIAEIVNDSQVASPE